MFNLLRSKFKEFENLKEGNTADEYEYNDPVDYSISKNQGLRFNYKDGSRIIFRLSGTGSVGATIRIYFEKYSTSELFQKTHDALLELIQLGLSLSNIKELTGRQEPTVIT